MNNFWNINVVLVVCDYEYGYYVDIDIWEYFNYIIGFFVKFVRNEYCLWNFVVLKIFYKKYVLFFIMFWIWILYIKNKNGYGIKFDVLVCINKLIFYDVICRKKGEKMLILVIFIW